MFTALVNSVALAFATVLTIILLGARYVGAFSPLADYVPIGCNDPMSQRLLIEESIVRGVPIPVDTCTNEEMAFVLSDSLLLLAAVLAVLCIVRFALMFVPSHKH